MAVNVDRVVIHRREIAEADAHAVAELCQQGRGAGKGATIEREDVEFYHFIRVGPLRARLDFPFAKHDGIVPVWRRAVRLARMNDEQAKHAERHLRHLVVMRVIHECAVLPDSEFVFKGLARLDGRLAQAAHAVHAARQQDAVPVNARGGGQFVRDVDAHAVALDAFDRGAVNLPIEAPAKGAQFVIVIGPGDKNVIYFLAGEMENLHAINHSEGQRGAVERHGRFVILARLGGRERRLRPGGLSGLVEMIGVRRRSGVLRAQERGQGRGARQKRRAADKVPACESGLILHGFFFVVFPSATEVGLRGVSFPPTVRSSFARVIQ